MRYAWTALILSGCAGSGAGAPPARAPEFEVKRTDGTPLRGSSLWKERSVLLVFMTSW